MRNIKTVATNGNGKKSLEQLDDTDMKYFANVLAVKTQAIEAAKAAQNVETFFWQTITPKYGLHVNDVIKPDGTITRNPYAEVVNPKEL